MKFHRESLDVLIWREIEKQIRATHKKYGTIWDVTEEQIASQIEFELKGFV